MLLDEAQHSQSQADLNAVVAEINNGLLDVKRPTSARFENTSRSLELCLGCHQKVRGKVPHRHLSFEINWLPKKSATLEKPNPYTNN